MIEPDFKPVPPGIYLVGTPIGNMDDITFRALNVLKQADVLACEDTRVTRKLFSRFGFSAPSAIYSCNDHNEKRVAAKLAELAGEGKVVAYCSDAGMPGISDPGYLIAQAAQEANVLLDVIPGPSAVPTALALAGLACGTFTFLGFPPRRDGRLAAILREHGSLRQTMVFYESPHRLGRLFRLAAEHVAPDRQAAACLELTKKFQRVIKGTLAELAEKFSEAETRGEATVIIEGAGKRQDNEDNG